jgi:hypothetical protein
MLVGGLLLLLGFLSLSAAGFPGSGRLPGDIVIERKNFSFYFPLMTSVGRERRLDDPDDAVSEVEATCPLFAIRNSRRPCDTFAHPTANRN